jgi:hypothetical protein
MFESQFPIFLWERAGVRVFLSHRERAGVRVSLSHRERAGVRENDDENSIGR